MNVWDRQEKETSRAYKAFTIYLNMGVNRSLQKAADSYYGKNRANRGQLEIWSSKYEWVSRVTAYDTHMAQLDLEKRRQEFEDDRKRAREARQRTIQVLQGLLNKALSSYRDLQTGEVIAPDPDSLNRLTSAARTIMDQSRQEFDDMPTQRMQQEHRWDSGQFEELTKQDIEVLSDADLARIAAGGSQ